ncbi:MULTISPECIES: molybdopterin molybdotransferase MoeA [Lactiplantibacillus]|uniref:Molybdopterin molybdenumtransferase n=1 Tax=Lactiplantibacillus pentosus TaxID=1589 RepID=A0AAW8WC84_LACPE|nr:MULTISPECIES: molybdopterin molybdotransferase MoeA [Lactiplantibacillus]MBU7461757.1 molybdopterin molybdotransferase MoeA [Lactiplantibacillus pentosus]MBU7477073.1 molybdopterin molybdotransferase MoeA [Lactiplantibacillus pentosus]MBU7484328.1 molybdopterin molybdotransferase MoeA [Lactiplantibacillus sp. 30.2.29]MBU7487666.1 molybdopterin molybdotransferase MoeA [Lactiplantibacillus pentosus]MBU7500732.1 molybdopterin molybdotransferase MoeA [Lactiplantibacillus pentosus]
MLTRRYPISITEAQAKINNVTLPTVTETIPVAEANHRVLAETVTAPFAYPHFRRSGVDGFAIRQADDHDYPHEFKVVGNVPAGATFHQPLGQDEAVRIMTGADVPVDAGVVVMLEKTRDLDDHHINIVVPEKHSNITEIGEEYQAGDVLIEKDTELNPGGLAGLTALGVQRVTVYRQTRVAVITTGSELMAADEPVQEGKIYNSNGILIPELVRENGGIVTSVEQLVDDNDLLQASLQKAIAENDIVITDGGVSVGDFDFIGDTARQADELLFNKIKQRPGSVTTAFVQDQTLVMALSGNPGACYTGFYLYVEPLLRRFVHQATRLQKVTSRLAAPYHKTNGFDRILRATYTVEDGQYATYPNGPDRSGALSNLQTTTCLIKIPHSNQPIALNAEVETWLLPFK